MVLLLQRGQDSIRIPILFDGQFSLAILPHHYYAVSPGLPWARRGSPALDLLGYNAYGDTVGNLNQAIDDPEWQGKINALQAAFGSKLYISEWNLPYTWPFPVPESQQATEIAGRVAFLASINIENYFFCYSWSQNSDYYALLKGDGTYRLWKNALFINPRPRQAVGHTRGAAAGRPAVSIVP